MWALGFRSLRSDARQKVVPLADPGWSALRLEGKQAVEEGTVAAERLAQLFGVDVVAFGPLRFQVGAFGGELLGNTFDHVGDQAVGLLYRLARLVDKGGLD